MNSINERPKSKCPFCGEETLPFGIRGELADRYGVRYWEDFHTYKCQTCEGEWEISTITGQKEITQHPNVRALKQASESKGTVFWPYKYNPGFQHERNTSWLDYAMQKKEDHTMQVSYKGFTGELVKLERVGTGKIAETIIPIDLPGASCEHVWFYNLSIYDREKKVTHSFTSVKLEEVKFLGGAVSFGG